MANLKNSRGKFFETHRMPRDRNFWLYYLEHIGLADQLSPHSVQVSLRWKPERSNCPELTEVLEDLIQRVPAEYRALAENLFVGRIIAGDVNAESWTKKKSGVIEISIQYMHVLTAYVAAFDEFFGLLRHVVTEIQSGRAEELEQRLEEINDRFRKPWSMLDDYRRSWLDPKLLVGGNVALLGRAPESRRGLQAVAVSSAEAFIVSHELAHHLLGHTVSRRDKRSARMIVDRALAAAGISERIANLNQSQREEIHADVLGFLLTADCIEKDVDFRNFYRALVGFVMTLISTAHITNQWLDLSPDGTHPGFLQRYDVIHDLVIWLTKDKPPSPTEGHPLGLLGQLAKFSGLALKYRLSQAFPEDHSVPEILNVLSGLIDFADDVDEKYLKKFEV